MESNPDIIAITEIKAKRQASIEIAEYSIPGYTLFINSKPLRGVALYLRDNLNAVECVEMNSFDFQEAVWCSFISKQKEKVLIGCVYKSPNSTDENVQNMFNMLKSPKLNKYDKVCIVGDFNFSTVSWQGSWTSTKDEQFKECIRDAYLHQMVVNPTRRRLGQRPTLDDLVLVNDEGFVSDITHHSPLGKSDHDILIFCLYVEEDSHDTDDTERFDLSKGNYEKMRKEFEGVIWNELHLEDVEGCWLKIRTEILESMHRNIPKIRANGNPKKGVKPVWSTSKVFKSVQRKHSLFKKYLASQSSNDYKRYLAKRNECKAVVRKAKRDFEKKLARNCKDNPKQFWRYVQSKTKSSTGISPLDMGDGNLIDTDDGKANVLNKFFASVFIKEEEMEDDLMVNVAYKSKGVLLSDVVITPLAVKEKLSKLCVNKAQGPDGIPPRVLKELSIQLANPLSILFNKSIEVGKIPEDWKKADVVAIFKKGTRSDPGNYRPVSLTCVLCKVLETFVRDVIVQFMTDQLLYSGSQHGFRKNRSCVTQLLEVMEKLTEFFEYGDPVDMIYLDFRKAFDSVPHKRLLCKMEQYGITANVHSWVEGFLSGRMQRVRCGKVFSSYERVLSGIPQGSVLGPILFTIFINDIVDNVESNCRIFADDTKVFNKAQNSRILQEDIFRLQDWTNKWKLFFNTSKCHVMHMGKNNPSLSYDMEANGQKVKIEQCTEEKDLGVLFDGSLSFDAHIQAAINKANRMLGIIRRTFTYLNKEVFLNLYKSLVRPHLEYASSVWAPRLKRQSLALERVQRRATRLLPDTRDLEYVDRLYFLNLPSLKYRRYRGDLIQTFKILNKVDDINPESFFVFKEGGVTRDADVNLQIRQCNTNTRKYGFGFRAAGYWNGLSSVTKRAKNINHFKSLLDNDPKRKIFRHCVD